MTLVPSTLQGRVLTLLAAVEIVSVLALTTFNMAQTARNELAAQRAVLHNTVALAEPSVALLLADRDHMRLRDYLQQLLHADAVDNVDVNSPDGAVVFSLKTETHPANAVARMFLDTRPSALKVSLQLRHNATLQGNLELTPSFRRINERLGRDLLQAVVMLAGLLIFSLGAVYWALNRFTTALDRLAAMARALDCTNPLTSGPPPESHGCQEIEVLAEALVEGTRVMEEHVNDVEETRARLQASEFQLRALVDNMREALFELDADGIIRFLNPAWQHLTGYAVQNSMWRPFTDFIQNPEDLALFENDQLDEIDICNREMQLRTAEDKPIWVELDARATVNPDGQRCIIGRFHDVSQRVELRASLKQHDEELYNISVTDDLTGLHNRRYFDMLLAESLPQSLQAGQPVCLALVDIDGFKFINDTYGHPIGDKVLKAVAELLRAQARPEDAVARLASDEFALILHDTDVEHAKRLAETLRNTISETRVALPIGHLRPQVSIGIAVAPHHGSSAQELVGAADVALYQAKRRGRGRVEVLSTDISQAIMEVFSRGFELRNALEVGDIVPSFQPIIDLHTGQPKAYEVLANMRRGDVAVAAEQFIKVAEDLGLVREIDLHIIAAALAISPPSVELFLNISLLSFNDASFGQELRRLIKPAREAGRPVTIEITERATLPLTDNLLGEIQSLRDLGCKLALDDFGHGYSTYGYLRRFRPEYVKIEGSFVAGMLHNEADRKLVEHIHDLAQSFGAVSIAENIESKALAEAVHGIGIVCGQGYLYGRPDTARKTFALA